MAIVATEIKERFTRSIHDLQNRICARVEDEDGVAAFKEDRWERAEGGGGITRVIAGGNVFEKGGVNTSVVHGEVTESMRRQLGMAGSRWFACGLSLVLHPLNPFVPTVHCNYRLFELYDSSGAMLDQWFGGGTDLTPYYLFEEDARHFHVTYKAICDRFDAGFYPRFKKQCDDYFVNWHRNAERRGIGGIFYDHERADAQKEVEFWFDFSAACADGFFSAYLPIVQSRKYTPYDRGHRHWQEIRRGRYAEFNLVHDRGTLFGLRTNGRIESILMSLPPVLRFEYDNQPAEGSPEAELLDACLHPREWV